MIGRAASWTGRRLRSTSLARMDSRLSFLTEAASVSSSLPVRTTFEHQTTAASGLVEAIYWPAKNGEASPPEQLTLFVLGNPGLLGYYLPFLRYLHDLLPPAHAILATSHLGHSPSLPDINPPVELQGQLESKIELVQALRTSLDSWPGASDSRPRLALMGHSLGGWLLMQVMKRLNAVDEVVSAGYLLFPTVGWIAKSWNGRTLWPLLSGPSVRVIPTLSMLLRPILPLTMFPSTTLSLLRSRSIIRNALALGRSELWGINDPDMDWIRSQNRSDRSKGLFGLWASGNVDGWVGEDGPMTQLALGGEKGDRVKILHSVPHAFCLADQHSELVAEVVAHWIDPGVPDAPSSSPLAEHASVIAEVAPM